MALYNRFTLNFIKSIGLRNLGTQAVQAVQVQEDIPQTFRTKETNPARHTVEHLSKFYNVPPQDVVTMLGASPLVLPELKSYIKTFGEYSILIRKPALEIINYLSQTDYSKPVNKYVIYGDHGTGKSVTMHHVLHYCCVTDKLLVYIPWLPTWYRFPRECANSSIDTNLVDLPIDGARYLLRFKEMNLSLLKKLDLKLSKTYELSVSDTFNSGTSLSELIDFGVNRAKYSCDVIGALCYEIKQASIAGKCNTLVAIDGYNSFFNESSQVKDDQKLKVPASRVSLTKYFLELTQSDWCNGQIVLTVDTQATYREGRDSVLPRYLLKKEGFDHLDPYLPIMIENYNEDELNAVVEYYKNRKWIRDLSPDGKKELKLISGSNPYKLREYCRGL